MEKAKFPDSNFDSQLCQTEESSFLESSLEHQKIPCGMQGMRVVVLPSSGLNELTLFDCYCSGLSAEGSAQVLAS